MSWNEKGDASEPGERSELAGLRMPQVLSWVVRKVQEINKVVEQKAQDKHGTLHGQGDHFKRVTTSNDSGTLPKPVIGRTADEQGSDISKEYPISDGRVVQNHARTDVTSAAHVRMEEKHAWPQSNYVREDFQMSLGQFT